MSQVPRGRRRWGWIVAAALLIVPLLEVVAIIAVGRVIGGWPTFFLLLAESALGAYLVRKEGRRTWGALREALGSGKMPSRELADAALVLVGGVLLLAPGFLTDIVGFLALLPITRPWGRRLIEQAIARRLVVSPFPDAAAAGGASWPGQERGTATGGFGGGYQNGPPPGGSGPIVESEVATKPE